ncbi:hypothetical protein BJ170DRAFT_141286 [Xylariales sp. AK1849]|nr:hypothetical protein BJ170DRAFT_141286 [Xylariales sp. AK1849]
MILAAYARRSWQLALPVFLLQPNLDPEEKVDVAKKKAHPTYKPQPSYLPPPIHDPFPSLATSTPPPIPSYNVPKKDVWEQYGLDVAPPLVIGFTRSWPILLQAVVSYITAGWPPEQIYVVENTGTQEANARGQLSLQNPFYLNHTSLKSLQVNVVQTPVLLTFAQLQNFFLSMSYTHGWPYYFWSHMDVLALSHENGVDNLTPPATDPGYKSIYTLCIEELRRTLDTDKRWATRFFAYDHLTLQNPRALEDIGGWDTLIPYYMTDCDTYSRFLMAGWSQLDANCGVVTDTSTVLDDLLALYRDPSIEPSFSDPNPPSTDPPKAEEGKQKREVKYPHELDMNNPVDYWWALLRQSDFMFHVKHGGRGRNTWQAAQHGGQDEPFYYDANGISESFDVLTEAGKEVFRRKWGHRDCDLIAGAGLKIEDQWRVMKDWE